MNHLTLKFFYITARLAKIEHKQQELADFESFFQEIENKADAQKLFFEYCKNHKLAPWIWVQMKRLNYLERLLPEIHQKFEDFHTQIEKQNQERTQTALHFLKKFEEQGIDVAILKGNLFLHNFYKDTGYKKMNDYDILIHKEDWERAQDIYLKANYIPLGFGWSGEKEKPAKFSHVGMSYLSDNYKCIIGTQWGIKSPTSIYKDNINEAWKTIKPFDLHGVKCKQLSTEYNLLHLVLHLGIYKCGTRDLMDIYNLFIAEKERIDEEKLVQILKDANAVEKAYFSFKLADELSDAIPKTLLEKLKPRKGYLLNRLQARLKALKESGDIHASYNDYFQDIEKVLIYFNLFPKFHKKLPYYLKIMKMLVWPTSDMALRLSDRKHKPTIANKLKARLVAPVRTIQLTGQEVGVGIIFLLIIKLFVNLIISPKNYFFTQKSYFDYLKSRNIDPNTIEKIVKGIQ